METIKVEREALLLDKTEKEKLLTIIRYCHHRRTNHDKTQAGDRAFMLYMINFLENNE